MAIYAASRYADPAAVRDVMLVQPNGTQLRTVYRRPLVTGVARVTTYAWRAGDRIDRVANAYLGDPAKWWKIMDVNPELSNPATIAPGTILRIPHA